MTVPYAPDTSWAQGDITSEVRELAAVGVLPGIYWLVAPLAGLSPDFDPVTALAGPIIVMFTVAVTWGAWELRPRRDVDSRWTLPATDRGLIHTLYWVVGRTSRHWLRGLVLMALATTFLDIYAAYKEAIPRFTEYTWDPLLSDLDRRAHGGMYPWHVLQGLLESPPVLLILDRIYWLWSGISIVFVGIAAWSPDRRLRVQFMLTFYSMWMFGGTLLAIAFASGGPVYFAQFAPDAFNPYEPLVQALHEVDGLMAVKGHQLLWEGFSGNGHTRTSGISAMPSMHVAMATLCALLANSFHRLFGVVAALYTLLIIIGSVVLAWHYAIDAYISIGLVLVLWTLAGRVAERMSAGSRKA